MKASKRVLAGLLGSALILGTVSPVLAAQVIGKIASFKGDVLILSGNTISKVTKVGQAVHEGDRIQTKQGNAEVKTTDGATLTVTPFSHAMIEERPETKGMLFWKKKQDVRRVTCIVGKLGFKSGKSKKKNYVQTPTAVCALRGTHVEVGYDNKTSYLNLLSGAVDVVGNMVRGIFNIAPGVASDNSAYQAVLAAQRAIHTARQPGATRAQITAAKIAVQNAIREAAQALLDIPDSTIARQAAQTAAIATARAKQALAAAALATATASGDQTAITAAQDALTEANAAVTSAETQTPAEAAASIAATLDALNHLVAVPYEGQ